MYRSLVVFGLFFGLTSSLTVGQVATMQRRQQMSGTAGTAGQPAAVAPVQGTPLGNGLVVNSGYVTTAPYGQISVPILAPPNVALPGSGPATGAPPALGVNDQRTGGTGSVVQPGVTPDVVIVGPGELTAAPTESATTGNPTAGFVLNTGMGKFIGSANTATSGATTQIALGDVARQYKARRAASHPREFDNSRIDALSNSSARNNPNLVPQAASAEPNASATEAAASASQTQPAVIDRRDLAIVEAELARSRAASANEPTAVQQPAGNTTIAQATQPQQSQGATTPQTPSASNAQAQAGAQKQQLPASASNLPLIGFGGLLAAGIGMAFAFRLRKS